MQHSDKKTEQVTAISAIFKFQIAIARRKRCANGRMPGQ